jgi:hypothetical protein
VVTNKRHLGQPQYSGTARLFDQGEKAIECSGLRKPLSLSSICEQGSANTHLEIGMTLEQYAFVAEIVGTVAVVISLIYLAVQVRHGIAQGRAEARYAFVQASGPTTCWLARR